MKTKLIIFILMLVASSCFAVTIQLRKGGIVKGDIVSKGREEVVLKTADGEKTIKWRQVKSSCIKEVYPELYEKLKAEAIERKKKKKEEETDTGKESAKENPDFSKIGIGITKTEKTGSFEKESDTDYYKVYSKLNQGILEIKLDWLKKDKTYKLKTVFTHYLQANNAYENNSFESKPSDVNAERIETISNKTRFENKYFTSPYREFKKQIKAGWKTVSGGKKETYYGYKSDGWDISVYLNGKLIYKEEKGKKPEYFIVRKL